MVKATCVAQTLGCRALGFRVLGFRVLGFGPCNVVPGLRYPVSLS